MTLPAGARRVDPPIRTLTYIRAYGCSRVNLQCPDCYFNLSVVDLEPDWNLPHLCVIEGKITYRSGDVAIALDDYVSFGVESFMTTSTTDTVNISLHHSDAVRYVRSARRPAVPEVRDLIKSAVDADPFAARHEITIPLDTARSFVKKSTRPLRLWTGSTMKSLIQYAIDEHDEAASATRDDTAPDASGEPEEGTVPAAVEAAEVLPAEIDASEDSEAAADLLRDDAGTSKGDTDGLSEPDDQYDGAIAGDVHETVLDPHSQEPDQEPSPVVEEGDEDPSDPGFPTTTHDEEDEPSDEPDGESNSGSPAVNQN